MSSSVFFPQQKHLRNPNDRYPGPRTSAGNKKHRPPKLHKTIPALLFEFFRYFVSLFFHHLSSEDLKNRTKITSLWCFAEDFRKTSALLANGSTSPPGGRRPKTSGKCTSGAREEPPPISVRRRSSQVRLVPLAVSNEPNKRVYITFLGFFVFFSKCLGEAPPQKKK